MLFCYLIPSHLKVSLTWAFNVELSNVDFESRIFCFDHVIAYLECRVSKFPHLLQFIKIVIIAQNL